MKENLMAEYARVVTFDADDAAIDALVNEINSNDGPPEDIPGTRITVLADRAAGKVLVSVRFGSEEDLEKGAATLEGMSPPAGGNIRRASVDVYEVLVDRLPPK
jgi:hypothetical protein